MSDLPYRFRWDRHDRMGQPCRVVARSHAGRGDNAPPLAFGRPARPRFNSVLVVFADGFAMVTSGNALTRLAPAAGRKADRASRPAGAHTAREAKEI